MSRSSDAERAWESLLRLHAAVLPRLERAVATDGGLPLGWYDVLLELNDAGGRLTMGKLGERVVLSRTRVSRLVDDLVAAGLVGREVNPDDGRSAYAVLTAAGRRRFLAGAKAYLPAIDREFAPVGRDGVRALADAIEQALIAIDPEAPIRSR
ncbi:MarR family transcriptional regulator [Agromyces endophyticus]|uniref:MarR family winged helix-turn-helix transcriptional regulator n=1 Tax=Agromyces sp. H17E-10 TaxID=2932244 RepID=UPI001FD36A7E|nr:MarR family winged helix-turn-helix transcriptional regulator [Agromyces sp. H17E-10]UOQ90148.1 MarR family transcriptional regulator [Agromyces sp. H17E-10]